MAFDRLVEDKSIYLQGLLFPKSLFILGKSTVLIRFAVPGISSGRAGAKLSSFQNNDFLFWPFFEMVFSDESPGDLLLLSHLRFLMRPDHILTHARADNDSIYFFRQFPSGSMV